MKLRARLDKLECAIVKASSGPSGIVRTILQPSASGPVLVAGLARRAGEPWRHIDREPGESEAALRARLERGCSP